MRKWPDAPFIRHLTFGNQEVLLVNNLEAAREVLQTHAYSFVKPNFFVKLVGEMMGTGVLFSAGEEHKQRRRIMAGKSFLQRTQKLWNGGKECAVGADSGDDRTPFEAERAENASHIQGQSQRTVCRIRCRDWSRERQSG